jgi:hypothetical protein
VRRIEYWIVYSMCSQPGVQHAYPSRRHPRRTPAAACCLCRSRPRRQAGLRQLNKEGKVKYKRDRPGKKLDLSLDLQGFDGDNFDVGFALVRSTFVVSKPPHREGDKWKMTVDGVELTRVDGAPAGAGQ